MSLKCIAFDCFGTVFDMADVPRSDIAAYVAHVRKADFTPFEFPASWWNLKAHPDAAEGIERLRCGGFLCVTLSNGDADLLRSVSCNAGIDWDSVIDLAKHRVYKPHVDAYRTIQKETGIAPDETLMVTANPTFGDLEGAAEIGMNSQVIRSEGYSMPSIIHLARHLGC